MPITKPLSRLCTAIAVLCLIQSGCVRNNIRTNAELTTKTHNLKTIVLPRPDIKIYEVSAGGIPELMDDWSKTGTDNVVKAIFSSYSSKAKIRTYETDSNSDRDMKELLALFEVVSQSIIIHTSTSNNNPNYFPDKARDLNYSLGSLQSILQQTGGDALLIVNGVDYFASAGKKAMNILGTITGVTVAALTGVAIVPKTEKTVLRVALADRDGRILWHNISVGMADLRDPASCRDFVHNTLESLVGQVK